jgi:hypothetical protein
MFYVHVDPDTGAARYPVTLTDFRRENPRLLMRAAPDPEGLAAHGLFPVAPTEAPAPDISKDVTRGAALQDGTWVEVWTVTDAPPEAVAERFAARRAGMVVTMRQARLALLGAGLLALVEGSLAAIEDEAERAAAQITWEFAIEVRRTDPLIAALAPVLGLTDEQIDALFAVAETL